MIYSEKEREMFTALGWDGCINEDSRFIADRNEHFTSMEAFNLYLQVISHTFISGLQGGAVEALRRAAYAFFAQEPKRGTPEFDALIYGLDDPPLNKEID